MLPYIRIRSADVKLKRGSIFLEPLLCCLCFTLLLLLALLFVSLVLLHACLECRIFTKRLGVAGKAERWKVKAGVFICRVI